MKKNYLKLSAACLTVFVSFSLFSPPKQVSAYKKPSYGTIRQIGSYSTLSIEDKKKIIETKEDLVRRFTKHIENLDENFTFYVSKKALKDFNGKDYNKLWEALFDVPEFKDIFAESTFSSYFYDYGDHWKWDISLSYSITKKDIEDLDRFIGKWVKKNIKPSMSDEKKVRKINDFMINEFEYNFGDKGKEWYYKEDNAGKARIGKYSVHSSFCLLHNKAGVCDSKANLFYKLAKKAGLEALYIVGYANYELHAWNMVKVNGKWYHLDVTWGRVTYDDAPDQFYNDRRFYLKSDRTMRAYTYNWNKKNYPVAKKDYRHK